MAATSALLQHGLENCSNVDACFFGFEMERRKLNSSFCRQSNLRYPIPDTHAWVLACAMGIIHALNHTITCSRKSRIGKMARTPLPVQKPNKNENVLFSRVRFEPVHRTF
jgi:hypothetical protein